MLKQITSRFLPFSMQEQQPKKQQTSSTTRMKRPARQFKANAQTDTPTLSSTDTAWLNSLAIQVSANVSNFHYSVHTMAIAMRMTRQHLNRRIRKLTGLTAQQYLREARLKKARRLLEDGTYQTVKATALEIGFKDIKHFSRLFKERFGQLPSDFL